MKTLPTFKTSCAIAALLLAGSASYAQITITESDLPQVFGVYISANDTTPTVTPGGYGANQTWDLSALKNAYVDTVFGENPSSGTDHSDFPSANIGIRTNENGSSTFGYGDLTASSLVTIGQYITESGLDYLVNITPGVIDVALPATYLTKWGGTYRSEVKYATTTYPGYDSIESIQSVTYTDTIDGWGSLKTPSGTYPALRGVQHSTTNYDSVLVNSSTTHVWSLLQYTPGGSSSESIDWFGNGKGYPLASMSLTAPYSNTLYSASYLLKTTASIDEISNNSSAQVYPNPASSSVTIIVKATVQTGYVKIIDLTGREIESSPFNNSKTQFNTSAYANGMYLYLITDKDGNLLDKGKFTVSH